MWIGSCYEEQRKHYKCSVGFENHSAAFMVRKEGERGEMELWLECRSHTKDIRCKLLLGKSSL